MKGFQSFKSGLPDTRQAFELLARAAATPAAARPAARTGPVVLYGAGELGQMALDWCRQQEVTVMAAVDANADRWREHPAWSGISLWTPETVPAALRQEHPLLLCLSTLPLQGIVERLQAQGWRDLRTFYDFVDAWPRRQSLNNGWHAAMPEGQSLAQTREVLSLWHDDVSRAHHLQFLAWRCLREEWQFADAPVHVNQRYAIPEFVDAWRPGERLLDAGRRFGAPDFDRRSFFRAVVDGRYKLVRWFSPREYGNPATLNELGGRADLALYDLRADPGEMENLARPDHPLHNPALIQGMLAKLHVLVRDEIVEDGAPFDLDLFGTPGVTSS